MQKVKNRKWILVTFIVLAIVVISIVAANIIIVSIAKSNSNRKANLLQNGPWSDEGIWKDSDPSLYLICSKTEAEPYAEVTAYVFVNNNWESFVAHLRNNIISFEDSEGNVQFTAKALWANQSLTLSKFEFKKDFAGIDKKELTLSKYSWDEEIEQLPFDLH